MFCVNLFIVLLPRVLLYGCTLYNPWNSTTCHHRFNQPVLRYITHLIYQLCCVVSCTIVSWVVLLCLELYYCVLSSTIVSWVLLSDLSWYVDSFTSLSLSYYLPRSCMLIHYYPQWIIVYLQFVQGFSQHSVGVKLVTCLF